MDNYSNYREIIIKKKAKDHKEKKSKLKFWKKVKNVLYIQYKLLVLIKC